MGLLDSCIEIVNWIISYRKRLTIFNRLLFAIFDPIGDSRRVRAYGGSFPTLSESRFLPYFGSLFVPFLYFVAHDAENLIGLNDSAKRFCQNIAFLVLE